LTKDEETPKDELNVKAPESDPVGLTLEERELLLKKKEADLAVKETELESKKADLRFRNKLYDKINVSVRTMDIVIAVLVVILLMLIAYGIYDAQH